ncbi:hypothetical protein L5515_009109 [Caenorhabditis briggsae]|uniref:Uncharacterized protein n=1 Tax=Caenorhabditis briggsae TaxID=6238 RepID=A0AAE9F801_CAEBR|nr:hypothetical protein L5515_009109 [Caenorhabditis briggsae]
MDKDLDYHQESDIDKLKNREDIHFEHQGEGESHCEEKSRGQCEKNKFEKKNEMKIGGGCPTQGGGQCKDAKRCDKMEDEPMDKRRESDIRNKEM